MTTAQFQVQRLNITHAEGPPAKFNNSSTQKKTKKNKRTRTTMLKDALQISVFDIVLQSYNIN